MSPRNRNFVTGLVVLLSLAVLGWMILTFSGRAVGLLKPKGTPVVFYADNGTGLADGSAVLYAGVQVGKVTAVQRMADNARVRITGEIQNNPPLPHNLTGAIRSQSALSNSSEIELNAIGGNPEGTLAAGDEIQIKFVGSGLIPPEVSEVLSQVQRQKLVQHVDETILSLKVQVEKAGKVMEDADRLLGDPKLRDDLYASIASIRAATSRADRIGANLETLTTNANTTLNKTNEHVEQLTRQVADNLDKLGQTFSHFEQITGKINTGKGTAGALVNDPKLYDELTDTARELHVVAASLARLVDQWEKEGVSLKLGGK